MTPYHSTRPKDGRKARNNDFHHPLEDPLNLEEQRDFVFLLERWNRARRGLTRFLKR